MSQTRLTTPVRYSGNRILYKDDECETDITTPGSSTSYSPTYLPQKHTSFLHSLISQDQLAGIPSDFADNRLSVIAVTSSANSYEMASAGSKSDIVHNADINSRNIVDRPHEEVTYLLLSDILKTCPEFSFFDEFLKIKALENSRLKNDLVIIENSILDVRQYLEELLLLFENLETIVGNPSPLNRYYDNIEWIFEGKHELSKIAATMESIDCLISQFLHIIELKLDQHLLDDKTSSDNRTDSEFHQTKNSYLKLLATFDEISDISLQVKKFIIIYKKRIEIAILFNELYVDSLDQINSQIDLCLKQAFKLQELKSLSVPVENYSANDLLIIIQSFTNDVPSNNNSRKSSIVESQISNTSDTSSIDIGFSKVFPIFSEKETIVYNEVNVLETLFNPLKTSMRIIKPRILQYCTKQEIAEFYSNSINDLTLKFKSIERKFHFFNRDVIQIKNELIYFKWSNAIRKLITSLEKKLDQVLKLLRLVGIVDDNPYYSISKHEVIPLEIEKQLNSIYKEIQSISKLFSLELVPKQGGNEALEKYFNDNIKSRWKNEFFNKLPPELVYSIFHPDSNIDVNLMSPKFSPSFSQKVVFETTPKNRAVEYRKKYALQLQQQQKQKQGPSGKHERKVSQNAESDLFIRSFSLSRSLSSSRVTSPVMNDGITSSPKGGIKQLETFNKRRSLTGSLLIGKMNIQPVLVDEIVSPVSTIDILSDHEELIENTVKAQPDDTSLLCSNNSSLLIGKNETLATKNPFKESEESSFDQKSKADISKDVENMVCKLVDLDLESVSEHTPSMIPVATFKSPRRTSFSESANKSFEMFSGGSVSELDSSRQRRTSSGSLEHFKRSISQQFTNSSFNSEDSMINDSVDSHQIMQSSGNSNLNERLRKMKRASSIGIPVPRATLKN